MSLTLSRDHSPGRGRAAAVAVKAKREPRMALSFMVLFVVVDSIEEGSLCFSCLTDAGLASLGSQV